MSTHTMEMDPSMLLETLEPRIAPAGAQDVSFHAIVGGTSELLKAGEGLSTSNSGGNFLLYVEKGQAMVFTTDFNQDGLVSANEITGIAAGDGLRLVSFVDIHGDIVTNLKADGTLTDSDQTDAFRDGKIVLASKIEKITLRTVQALDVAAGVDPGQRTPFSTYSIYGDIFAGGGFGTSDGGLVFDTSGFDEAPRIEGLTFYPGGVPIPGVGSIRVGTAVSGESFSFGIGAESADLHGRLANFYPASGVAGADIINISPLPKDPAILPSAFHIAGLYAGDGGFGARGGNISLVNLSGDISGVAIVAGDGGDGPAGGAGGSVTAVQYLAPLVATSAIYIKTGDGGIGISGAGGAGGAVSLGDFNVLGNIHVVTGSGGDGLTKGGDGAILGNWNLNISSQESLTQALAIAGSVHLIGDIGASSLADFDADGFGDVAFITKDSNQLVVVFGNRNYDLTDPDHVQPLFDPTRTIYLDGPVYTTDLPIALTLGDFDGNGRIDIATASNSVGATGDLMVFLSVDADQVPEGEAVHFTDALHSTLPFFDQYFRSPLAITSLASGDFDGDLIVDLAVIARYATFDLPPDPNAPIYHDVLILMKGDANPLDPAEGTGYFYASYDPGIPATVVDPAVPAFFHAIEIGALPVVAPGFIKSTSFDTGVPDGLIYISTGGSDAVFGSFGFTLDPLAGSGWSFTGLSVKLDTNRAPGQASNPLVEGVVIDVAILDVDGDGVADLVPLTDNGYIVVLQGDGSGDFAQTPAPGDQAGILISAPNPNGGLLTQDGVKLIHIDGGIGANGPEVGIFDIGSERPARLITVDLNSLSATTTFLGRKSDYSDDSPFSRYYQSSDITTLSYAASLLKSGDLASDGSEVQPALVVVNDKEIPTFIGSHTVDGKAAISDYSVLIETGNGGNASLGLGGKGGNLGKGMLSSDGLLASVNISIPYGLSIFMRLITGDGGDGYTGGGAAGNISGLRAAYSPAGGVLAAGVFVFTGDGGDSQSGTGGAGGSISAVKFDRAFAVGAGDGGSGYIGGAGGSLTGRGNDLVADDRNAETVLFSGKGGDGIIKGGDGGSIQNFRLEFLPYVLGVGGKVYVETGAGGDAPAGTAGKGGDIRNTGPTFQNNHLAGDMMMVAGAGGDGRVGGGGGSISGVLNNPVNEVNPTSATFIAGDGGNGSLGNGGAGGSLSSINVTAKGQGSSWSLVQADLRKVNVLDADPTDPFIFGVVTEGTGVAMSRFVAGNGGSSAMAIGGKGGNIASVVVSTIGSSTVLAAGAGGSGLSRGGDGGSVTSSTPDAKAFFTTSEFQRSLIIAGDGGVAYGYRALDVMAVPDLMAMSQARGEVAGTGGNGGSISNLNNTTSLDTIFDLVAGNGGNIAYGLVALNGKTNKLNVGKGGSVTDVEVRGNIGSFNPTPLINIPLKAYNDLDFQPGTVLDADADGRADGYRGTADATMADFIRARILGNAAIPLTDSDGNVGIIVGASGRSLGDQPVASGLAGSATNIKAKNILSIVAGSIDRVALVTSVSGIQVETGGVVGGDKAPTGVNGQLDYYRPGDLQAAADATTANPLMPVTPTIYHEGLAAGGGLIDGAVIAKKITGLTIAGRVFLVN